MPDPQTPYQRGYDAAWRVGEYLGAEDVPKCPYPEDSPEAEQWHDGFGDGTDFYEFYNYGMGERDDE
jgi:hypothetical protein